MRVFGGQATRAGLFGCVVQLAYSPLTHCPVRRSVSPGFSACIVMHSGTGQTETHRLQPTHSASITSNQRLPSFVAVIAWCEVSSQTTWQRPHWIQASWSIVAFSMWFRFSWFQLTIDGTARPRKASMLWKPFASMYSERPSHMSCTILKP